MSMKWLMIMVGIAGMAVCEARAELQRVVIDDVQEWLAGESVSAAVGEPGQVSKGVRIEQVLDLGETTVWDSAWSDSFWGVIGSGPEGRVLRVGKDWKEAKELAKLPQPMVYAVAVSPGGEVFAADSPNGKVYRIPKGGKEPEVYFEHGQEVVWDMAFDAKGRLLVATGTEGKLFRVDRKGEGREIFDAEETHVRSLLSRGETLYFATGKKGLLYRIVGDGKPFVVFDSEKEEISAMEIDPQGRLYFAVNESEGGAVKSVASVTKILKEKKEDMAKTLLTALSGGAGPKGAGKSSVMASGKAKPGKIVSHLYRVEKDGYSRRLLQSPYLIHDLFWKDGKLWVGTGGEGSLYSVEEDGEWALMGSAEESEQVFFFDGRKGGEMLLLGNNGARLFRVDALRGKTAVYRTQVVDSGLFARWGRVDLSGPGGAWEMRTRSGNTASPDKSWSEWEGAEGGSIRSAPSRFLQMELRIKSGAVSRLELFYSNRNLPPQITKIKILEPNLEFELIKQQKPQLPPQSDEQLVKGTSRASRKKPVRFKPMEQQGMRALAWQATDPNDDELEYTLHVRPSGSGAWELLAEELEETAFSWDASGWPEGEYDVKVTASDAPSNSSALTAVREAGGLVVDHTPPVFVLVGQKKEEATVAVKDAWSLLEKVEISYTGAEYRPLLPVDGVLDSRNETFRVKRKKGLPVYIRAKDAVGNVSGYRMGSDS